MTDLVLMGLSMLAVVRGDNADYFTIESISPYTLYPIMYGSL